MGTGPATCTTCGGDGQVRKATRTPFSSFTQVAECPNCNGSGQIIATPCLNCGGNRSCSQEKVAYQNSCRS